MIENTATNKTRKPRPKSKAAQIRKLLSQGKLTAKQIAERVNVPATYVYVVRSKMKAEAGGLPAVATKSLIPVAGGIQEVASEAELRKPPTPTIAVRPEEVEQFKHMQSPAVRPMQITMVEPPTFFGRVKERIRAWLS